MCGRGLAGATLDTSLLVPFGDDTSVLFFSVPGGDARHVCTLVGLAPTLGGIRALRWVSGDFALYTSETQCLVAPEPIGVAPPFMHGNCELGVHCIA